MVIGGGGQCGNTDPSSSIYRRDAHQGKRKSEQKTKREVLAAAKRYQEELLAEVNADREAHGKKPLDDEDEPPKAGGKKQDNTSKKKQARRKKAAKKQKTVTVSTTDPECGMFHKGEHKRCFAYEAHTVCDKNGYVLEAVVTTGNVHDSVAFDDVYDNECVPYGTHFYGYHSKKRHTGRRQRSKQREGIFSKSALAKFRNV